MKVECTHCRKVYNIPDERLSNRKGISFPCPACKGIIELHLNAEAETRPITEPSRGQTLKERILKTIKDLPPMPQSVIKAQSVMRNPQSNFKDLAGVLETDQALAAKVLRMANSPFYGLAGKVSSLHHASVVLGQKTIEELITVAGTRSLLGGRLEGYGLHSGDLWLHSIGVALGSKLVSLRKFPDRVNDAFSAGLIHDVGKLALDSYVKERKEEFENFLEGSGESFTSAEKSILGFDHAEIAGELCGAWNMPGPLMKAVACHHRPADATGDILVHIVHTADIIAMMSGLGVGSDGMQYPLDSRSLEVLRIKESDLAEIMADMVEAVHALSTEMEKV
jgi:HD-like signal output (HDOD) protein